MVQEVAKMKLDAAYSSVLKVLARYRSMPFLELTARVPEIGDDELEIIISDLESQDMVKVVNRGDILEEIVTLKKKGIAAAA